ncbi:MAG: hypothetical protein JST30_11850 [Armatimonadetes bacterium]|nr:hypothetical protein [Armatimonadota bacterium]
MLRNLLALCLAAALTGLLAGCGSGETSSSDLKTENDQIKKQSVDQGQVAPINDTVQMGGPGGSGGGSNIMPKGVRDKK